MPLDTLPNIHHLDAGGLRPDQGRSTGLGVGVDRSSLRMAAGTLARTYATWPKVTKASLAHHRVLVPWDERECLSSRSRAKPRVRAPLTRRLRGRSLRSETTGPRGGSLRGNVRRSKGSHIA